MSEQNVMKNLLAELRSHLAAKNQAKCVQKIEIIAEFFEAPLTSSEISKLKDFS
jgi:hypothetical protein